MCPINWSWLCNQSSVYYLEINDSFLKGDWHFKHMPIQFAVLLAASFSFSFWLGFFLHMVSAEQGYWKSFIMYFRLSRITGVSRCAGFRLDNSRIVLCHPQLCQHWVFQSVLLVISLPTHSKTVSQFRKI